MSDLAERTRRELEEAGYRLDGVEVEAPFMRPGHETTRVLYRIDIDGEDQVIEGSLLVDNSCTAGYIARMIRAVVGKRVSPCPGCIPRSTGLHICDVPSGPDEGVVIP